MLKPVRTAAPDPTKPLVTLAECMAHIRQDAGDDESLVEGIRDAVVSYFDGYSGILGRALINQTWKINFSGWPCDEIRLPFSPVQSIASIKYYDALNSQQTVSSSNYALLEDHLSPYVKFIPTYLSPTPYDRDDAIEVLFVAGFGAAASAVPAAIRHAALMTIGHLYENRETVVIDQDAIKLPMGAEALLAPFRRRGV